MKAKELPIRWIETELMNQADALRRLEKASPQFEKLSTFEDVVNMRVEIIGVVNKHLARAISK